ncbi:hypothetical protein [Francisella philomiragia]|uniref:hypothetical protein n=1 Tax=Francisella philomiragia TaxID=28110 RepID=UPI001B8D3C7A|nr:hypothetical protein [Francisella philomiragia]QUE32190.1 hypothetical protein IMS64_04075 [Francisella philomiragia]
MKELVNKDDEYLINKYENKKIISDLFKSGKEVKLFSLKTQVETVDNLPDPYIDIFSYSLPDITGISEVMLDCEDIPNIRKFNTEVFIEHYEQIKKQIKEKGVDDKFDYLAKFCFRYSIRSAIYFIILKVTCFHKKINIPLVLERYFIDEFEKNSIFIELFKENYKSFDIYLVDKDRELDFSDSHMMIYDSIVQFEKYWHYHRNIKDKKNYNYIYLI